MHNIRYCIKCNWSIRLGDGEVCPAKCGECGCETLLSIELTSGEWDAIARLMVPGEAEDSFAHQDDHPLGGALPTPDRLCISVDGELCAYWFSPSGYVEIRNGDSEPLVSERTHEGDFVLRRFDSNAELSKWLSWKASLRSPRWIMGMLLDSSLGDRAVYPQTINGEPRTAWQEGWNAGNMDLLKRRCILSEWWKGLDMETAADVVGLLGGQTSLRIREGEVHLSIDLNDIFAFNCADCEDVPVDEIPVVARLWCRHGFAGLVAWVSCRRDEEPLLDSLDVGAYKLARELLQEG